VYIYTPAYDQNLFLMLADAEIMKKWRRYGERRTPAYLQNRDAIFCEIAVVTVKLWGGGADFSE